MNVFQYYAYESSYTNNLNISEQLLCYLYLYMLHHHRHLFFIVPLHYSSYILNMVDSNVDAVVVSPKKAKLPHSLQQTKGEIAIDVPIY